MSRIRGVVLVSAACCLAAQASPLQHSVSDFHLDWNNAPADIFQLDPGWGDSLLIAGKTFSFQQVYRRNLSDALYTNGAAGGSPIAAATGPNAFRVAYLAWDSPQSAPPPGGDAPQANVVMRNVTLDPDTALVDDKSDIIAGREVVVDQFLPHKFNYLNPGSPPPPSYFNFSAQGGKYVAYWGSQTAAGPIRRTTYLDAGSGGLSASWGTYVTPTTPVVATNYGKVSAAAVPGAGGGKTVLAYETSFSMAGASFEIRWEDVDIGTSVGTGDIVRPVQPEDFSVAADSAGNALVLWRENSNLYATGYDASHTQILAPIQIQTGVFIKDSVTHWYRPYGASQMVNGNFMVVYSRVSGPNNIVYAMPLALPVNGQSYSLGAEKQISPTGNYSMFPDISVSRDRVVVGWFQRAAGSGNHRFMGSLFDKTGTDVLTPGTTLDMAGENISFGGTGGGSWYRWHWFKCANVAMDLVGNVVVAYDNGFNAKVSLVRNTPTYYDSAAFTSKTFHIDNPSIPSFQFDPAVDSAAFLAFTVSDTTRVALSLAVSSDSLFPGADGKFLPVSSPRLAAGAYYKYRAVLYSDPATHLKSPKLKSLDLDINVKPRLTSVDSIQAGVHPRVKFDPAGGYILLPRKDSLKVTCSAFDLDDDGVDFRISLGTKILKSSAGSRTSPGNFHGTVTVFPPDTALSPLPLIVTAVDSRGWASRPDTLYFDFRNIVPTQSVRVYRNRSRDSSHVYRPVGGGIDTLSPVSGQSIVVQQTDTLAIKTAFADGNDDTLTTRWLRNGAQMNSRRVFVIDTLAFNFPGDSIPPQVDTLQIRTSDPETTIVYKLLVRTNRPPDLDSIVFTGYKGRDSVWKVGSFDAVRNFSLDTGITLPLGLPAVIEGFGKDPDAAFGDSTTIRWFTWKPTTGCSRGDLACYQKTDSAWGPQFTHTYIPAEQFVTSRILDTSGAFKERTLALEYAVADSGGNGPGGLHAAVLVLTGGLDFIIGSNVREKTVTAQINSQGSTPLRVLSVATQKDDRLWLAVKMTWLSGTPPRPDSLKTGLHTSVNIVPGSGTVSVAPGLSLNFSFRFFTDSLRGDSILVDTLLVQTNDYANPVIKIPFRMVYNDLPLVRIAVPGSKSAGGAGGYNTAGLPAFLPARSKLVFGFSEPVKILNPSDAIRIYSYLDSLKAPKSYRQIPGFYDYRRKGGSFGTLFKSAASGLAVDSIADTVIFTPNYAEPSDSLKVKPGPGYFIYRDWLRIGLTNGITDRVGNPLDLRLNKTVLVPGTFDTVFALRVDTSVFHVVKSQPDPGQSGWNPDDPVRIHFNRKLARRPPLGADTVTLLNLTDLKGDENQSIRVTSRFSVGKRYNFQYLALENNDSTLAFKTRPRFAAYDTVTVALSGGILDTSGLSLDGDGDFFPDWLYSRNDSIDIYTFAFQTRDQEFYVFPNPFHFGDARHREKGSITFKNINTLSGFEPGIPVTLRIHTMDGNLVYNSEQAGGIRSGFTGQKSLFYTVMDWDLKNLAGNPVGTGVYVYSLSLGNSKLLRKGKVAVVR